MNRFTKQDWILLGQEYPQVRWASADSRPGCIPLIHRAAGICSAERQFRSMTVPESLLFCTRRETESFIHRSMKTNITVSRRHMKKANIRWILNTEVKKMALKIINPGLFTTVQDLGRYGYESYGFTPAGVMDYESYYLANALLGNDSNCGVLELTLYGITYEVLHSTSMSSAGAEMELTINEEPFETGTAVDLVEGDIVRFGGVNKGARTYIAFSGGLDLRKELGSYSTHTRSQMGGYKGRVLKAWDILPVKGKTVEHNFPVITKILTEDTEIRFIPGQQNDRFDSVNKRIFTESEYTLTKDSDRMGCRLEGPAVEAADDDDIRSEERRV